MTMYPYNEYTRMMEDIDWVYVRALFREQRGNSEPETEPEPEEG